jgi:hypothetical protein
VVREFHQVDPAVPPRAPIASHQRALTAFAAAAGGLACLTLLLLIEYFRGRIITGQELAEVTGAPLLATLRTGRTAAGYDVLAARIALAGEGAPMRAILVSGDSGTDVANRLADAIDDAGQPVARVALPPTATPDTVRSAIEAERDRRIVIDAPPPDRSHAALTCAGIADATILVARQGRSSRESLAQSAANVRQAGGTLLGVALLVKRGRVRAGSARVAAKADGPRAVTGSPEPA